MTKNNLFSKVIRIYFDKKCFKEIYKFERFHIKNQ